MKTAKKVLSIILAVVLVIGTVVVAATAAEDHGTATWTFYASVMDSNGGAEEALASGAEATPGVSVTTAMTKQQRADKVAFTKATNLEVYNSNDTIYVKPGQVVWVTVHLKTQDVPNPATIQSQFYYSTNIFTCTTALFSQVGVWNTSGVWAEYVDKKDGTSFARQDAGNRKTLKPSVWTDEQRAAYNTYNIFTFADLGKAVDEVFYPLDEYIIKLPVYVRPDAQTGAKGTIFMTKDAPFTMVVGYPDFWDSSVYYNASTHDISAATLNFVVGEKPGEVDYTALNAAIAKYEALNETDYTVDTWASATTAYNAAKAALSSTDQATVTAAAEALEAAIDALKKPAALDFSGLTAAINAAESKTLSDYTTSTANAVTAALEKAIEVGKSATTQPEIDKAAADLNAAVAALKAKANISTLKAAIAEANAKTEANYTADSWKVLSDAVAAGQAIVDKADETSDQAAVDVAANAIYAAINNLVPNGADYSAVEAAKAKIPADLSIYTDASVKALNDAVAAVVEGLPASRQSEVDKMAADIEAAITGLKEKDADYSAVDAAKAKVPTDLSIYTDASVKALNDALAAVVEGKKASEQAVVDGWAAAIEAAITGLKEKDADYSAVDAAKAKIPADLSIYTDETVKALNDAVAAVVEGKKVSEQAVVDGWAAAIESAISGLRVKSASLEALKAAIAEAEALNSALYTPESFAAVTTALANAKQVRDSAPEITDQVRVDQATAALKNAIALLVPAGADFSALKSALDEAKTLTASHYTADSWKAYSDAVAAGQAIYDNAEQYTVADQATIDAAAKAITDAKAALVEAAADYSAVTEQQTIAASKKQSDYTAESWANLQTALNAVVNGLKAKDQAKVDKFAADIKAAIGALEYVDANYDMINNQKTIIAGLTETDYTKASWAALQAELAKVVEGKKIDEQDLVDEWADNIRAARLALVKAPAADYTDVNAAVAEFEKLDSSLYTAASVKKVEDAIAAVDYTLNENFQSTVDAYADAINAAIDALELKPAPGAGDYTAVDAAIAKFNAIADKSVYTDASVKAVEDAIAAVVRGLDETHQAEIDAMAKAINDAIGALELKPVVAAGDYKAVDAAIARANTYNAAEYTAESWARVDAAIKAVVRGLDETHQAEIDAMAAAIINALDALEKIPASTGRVVSVEYTPSAFTLNTYNFKVTGRAIAIRLLVASDTTSTITLYRNNPAITVTSYNSNGEVVSDLAKDIAYEVWSINKSFVPNSYYVIARDNTGWEMVTDSTQLFRVVLKADDKDVKSITPAASTVKAGEKFDVTVVTGADVIKVRTRVDGVVMCTFDVFSYGTIGENSNTFNIFAKVYSKGEHTITVDVKTANGWETVDTISATVIGE